MGVNLGRAPAPDETTILNFRHLLERHDLCGAMLDAVNHSLEDRGIRIGTGTIVDAMTIHAPSSTKNATGTRDPEIASDAQGQPVVFRDDGAPQGRWQGRHRTFAVLHGGQRGGQAYAVQSAPRPRAQGVGRRAYQGQGETIRKAAPHAQDMTSRRTRYKQVVDELQRR